jgi:GNAT superfamily N-acetyltransferase
MQSLPGPNPNIEIRVSVHPERDLTVTDLDRVIEGISREDMRLVDIPELLGSHATVAAFDISDSEARIVGFSRQVKRDNLISRTGRLSCVELGSVWVDPEYRGKNIGRALIEQSTTEMLAFNFLPLAVCNEDSRKIFEKMGYIPIGVMPRTKDGHARVVEMFNNYRVTSLLGLRSEVIRKINKLPRFREMDIASRKTKIDRLLEAS